MDPRALTQLRDAAARRVSARYEAVDTMLDIPPYVRHNALVRWHFGLLGQLPDMGSAVGIEMADSDLLIIHAMRLRARNRDDYERVMRWHER